MTVSAGLDLGSTTLKLVLMEEGQILRRELERSVSHPHDTARRLLTLVPSGCRILATGYGRDLMEVEHQIPTITEIKAHAVGARFLAPDCSAVIDIGGQDVKAIRLDGTGRVSKFEMNERCAAGTGMFLEVMARRLGYPLDAFKNAALEGSDHLTINALCTVFAESEVVGLLNRGQAREDIARALHRSIAKRITAMCGRLGLGPADRGLVTGGGAHNGCLVAFLQSLLGCPLEPSDSSQFAGAIGCALITASAGNRLASA